MTASAGPSTPDTAREASSRASTTRAAADPNAAAEGRLLVALVLLATVQLLIVLDTTIVNVALPTIQDKVGFAGSSIAWVVNGYALAFGSLLLLGGRSGDLLGRRAVFVASLVGFAAASMVAGLAEAPGPLIAARVVQGASAAFSQATALSLIVSSFPAGPARNRAIGVFAAMEGLGAGAGLLLGGVIVDALSWRWVFFINVPIVLLVLVLTPRFIPAPARRRDRFDLPGAITATAGLAAVVLGLSRAADHGWATPSTLWPLLIGTVALFGFILIERRGSSPLMPMWVFADRNRSGAYAIQALLGAALFGMFFLVTLFLQHVLHYGAFKAGAAFVPATVIMMAAAGLMTRVVARTGVRPPVAAGTAVAAVGMWLLSNVSPDSEYVTGVMLPMMLLTTGLGSVFVPATLAAVSGVREEHSGLVSGVSTTAIQIGGSIGLAVLATVAASTTRNGTADGISELDALTAGFTRAFQVAAVILALAVPIALGALRLHPSGDTTGDTTGDPTPATG